MWDTYDTCETHMTHVRHIWHTCINVAHCNISQVLNMTGASLPVLQSDMFTRAGLPNLQRLFLRWTQIQWQWQWQIQWQFRGCSLAQPPWADLCYISFLTLASITVKLTFASPKLFILSWTEKLSDMEFTNYPLWGAAQSIMQTLKKFVQLLLPSVGMSALLQLLCM